MLVDGPNKGPLLEDVGPNVGGSWLIAAMEIFDNGVMG